MCWAAANSASPPNHSTRSILQNGGTVWEGNEFAGLTEKGKVLDAYCGIGTIGIIMAKRGAGEVTGVEVNRDAVKDAIANAWKIK